MTIVRPAAPLRGKTYLSAEDRSQSEYLCTEILMGCQSRYPGFSAPDGSRKWKRSVLDHALHDQRRSESLHPWQRD